MNKVYVRQGHGYITGDNIDDITKNVEVILVDSHNASISRYILESLDFDQQSSISYKATENKVVFNIPRQPVMEYECVSAPME